MMRLPSPQQTDTAPSESPENGLRIISRPTAANVKNAFVCLEPEEIRLRWHQYQRKSLQTIERYVEPDLEVLHSSDISVHVDTCKSCRVAGFSVFPARKSDETDYSEFMDYNINLNYSEFMGYNTNHECYAFSGHRCLLDRFLKLMETLFLEGKIREARVRPDAIRIRLEGLNQGLDFEAFASRIETLSCVLLLTLGQSDPINLDSLVRLERPSAGRVFLIGDGTAVIRTQINLELAQWGENRENSEPEGITSASNTSASNTSASNTSASTLVETQRRGSRYSFRQRKDSIKYT